MARFKPYGTYSASADALYVYLSPAKEVETTTSLDDRRNIDYGAAGEVSMSLDVPRFEGDSGKRPQQPRFANARAMVAALKPSYPVYCVRPQVVKAAARAFLDEFPGRVLYAVKCNPHPLILRALYEEGIRHFDTASLAEIEEAARAEEQPFDLAVIDLRLGTQSGIELIRQLKKAQPELLVVLCSEHATQPVVNTGTLYQ